MGRFADAQECPERGRGDGEARQEADRERRHDGADGGGDEHPVVVQREQDDFILRGGQGTAHKSHYGEVDSNTPRFGVSGQVS
ncbi:hypothetical protein [Streptomyces sp. S186]|uniref:hypothetical protein n=1 Tax=Streptomyces sp. S186 TaxID=3434395 RepID=UPI003F674069